MYLTGCLAYYTTRTRHYRHDGLATIGLMLTELRSSLSSGTTATNTQAMRTTCFFFFFLKIIYIALSIASINTMMLMQPLGLWSAAHAKHNPSFLGSTTWCYQLQSFTCVVQFAYFLFLSLFAILTLLYTLIGLLLLTAR